MKTSSGKASDSVASKPIVGQERDFKPPRTRVIDIQIVMERINAKTGHDEHRERHREKDSAWNCNLHIEVIWKNGFEQT